MLRLIPLVAFLSAGCHWIFPYQSGGEPPADRSLVGETIAPSNDAVLGPEGPLPDLPRDAAPDARADVRPDARVLTQVTTFAGSGAGKLFDGPAGQAGFNKPHGLAVDGAGKVYVAEGGSSTIRLIAGGTVSTLAGQDGVTALTDGTTAEARFNNPRAVTLGPAGALYVADCFNDAIRMITSVGVTTVATGLAQPEDVVADSKGVLYVAEWGERRVQRIIGNTKAVLAGTGKSGLVDGPAATAQFMSPHMLALDETAQKLYVTDWGAGRVRVIDLQQQQVSSLADGAGSPISFVTPAGVALDPVQQRLYVSEAALHRIQVIDLATGTASVLLGTGTAGHVDDPLKDAMLNTPEGLALDAAGQLFIAELEGHRIRRVE